MKRIATIASSIALLLAVSGARAEDSNWYTDRSAGVALEFTTASTAGDLSLLPQNDTFRFNSADEFYDKRKYTEDFRIKGVRIGEGVYFGEARIAGEKGPGIVVERGDLFWGFNHRGAEILFRF